MVKVSTSGSFDETMNLLHRARKTKVTKILKKYGAMGVNALKEATPKDTGLTADSWYYTIEFQNARSKLVFCNSNVVDHVSIAVVLQYGHATRSGSWVEGIDYIGPALEPIFKELADAAWKEVIGV